MISIRIGEMAELGVYAAGNPPLESGEIVWSRSDGSLVDVVSDGSRFSLSNGMQLLSIDGVEIEDSGTYQIEIVRDDESKDATSIDLNVHGKLLQSQQNFEMAGIHRLVTVGAMITAPQLSFSSFLEPDIGRHL